MSTYHVIGKHTSGAAIGNSGIVFAIAEPVDGNYAFSELLIAMELGAS